MQYNFSLFTERNRRTKLTSEPEVRLQKGARFVLNTKAHQILGEPEDVELLWDAQNHVMGIRAASANARALGYAYKLRHPANSGLYTFASRRFAELVSGSDKLIEGAFSADADGDMIVVHIQAEPESGGSAT